MTLTKIFTMQVVSVRRRTDWDDAKLFRRAVAEYLVASAPDRYIATMSKDARKGKVFIDYLRNGRGATTIAPYSTRAHEGVPVSGKTTLSLQFLREGNRNSVFGTIGSFSINRCVLH